MARFSKHLILVTSYIFLLTSTLSSCQEGGNAGDLLGQWRLEGYEDMYVSFSGTITQFRKANGQHAFDKGNIYGDCSTFNLKINYHGKIL